MVIINCATEVLWTFSLDYTKGWGVRPHEHDHFQIYYCVSGSGVTYLDDKAVVLNKGDRLIIHPYQKHMVLTIKEGSMRIIDTKFRIHDEALKKDIQALPQLAQVTSSEFQRLQNEMLSEWISARTYARDFSHTLLQQSLILLIRENTAEHNRFQFSMARMSLRHAVDTLTGPERMIADYIVEINQLEEEGDRLYVAAMKALHTISENPLDVIVWRGLYDTLENVCDQCEDVADLVEAITIGNG